MAYSLNPRTTQAIDTTTQSASSDAPKRRFSMAKKSSTRFSQHSVTLPPSASTEHLASVTTPDERDASSSCPQSSSSLNRPIKKRKLQQRDEEQVIPEQKSKTLRSMRREKDTQALTELSQALPISMQKKKPSSLDTVQKTIQYITALNTKIATLKQNLNPDEVCTAPSTSETVIAMTTKSPLTTGVILTAPLHSEIDISATQTSVEVEDPIPLYDKHAARMRVQRAELAGAFESLRDIICTLSLVGKKASRTTLAITAKKLIEDLEKQIKDLETPTVIFKQ